MKIRIISVGKIKEKFYREAIDEYSKRLSRYCNLEIVEVPDEMTPDKASDAENLLILKKEGERILSKLHDNDYVITLEIEGHKLSSVQLSDKISSIMLSGVNSITFIIGGSLGLSDDVKKKASYSLSFSDMTFPHQLMRVVLLEQVYRSYKIMSNEPYHK